MRLKLAEIRNLEITVGINSASHSNDRDSSWQVSLFMQGEKKTFVEAIINDTRA